jgi:hypothetical protein
VSGWKPHENTIQCDSCGKRLPIFKSVTRQNGVLIPDHDCDRFLVGVLSIRGELLKIETSEYPGVTGPVDLVRRHGDDAEEWGPIGPGSGWHYYWHPFWREAA